MGDGYSQISSSDTHSCARKTDGTLWCWGMGWAGGLGTGDEDKRSAPVQVGVRSDWLEVTTDMYQTCGIVDDPGSGAHSLLCWGWDPQTDAHILSPTLFGSDSDWEHIVSSPAHFCGLRNGGELWCWGQNSAGQLGQGDTTDDWTPVRENTNQQWADISASIRRTGAILSSDKSLWTWGGPPVGDGSEEQRTEPTLIDATSSWLSVESGESAGCAIREDHSLWCWGYNINGQLGIGDNTNAVVLVPTQVDPGTQWAQVSLGGRQVQGVGEHSCGIQTNGSLWCWGKNDDGRCGASPESSSQYLVPHQVGSATNWLFVSAGDKYNCAIDSDGGLWCWGADDTNTVTKIGAGDSAVQFVPNKVLFP